MGCLVIREVALCFRKVSLELEDVLLVVTDLVIKSILLVGVGGLEFSDLVAVDFSQSADLLEQVGDFTVFEVDLSTQDLRFVVFGLDGSVEIIEFGLSIILDLLHGGRVIFKRLVALQFHADDLLAEHVDRMLLILGQLLALGL